MKTNSLGDRWCIKFRGRREDEDEKEWIISYTSVAIWFDARNLGLVRGVSVARRRRRRRRRRMRRRTTRQRMRRRMRRRGRRRRMRTRVSEEFASR